MLQLASPFSSGAVFQRNKRTALWGTAASRNRIQVSFAGNTSYVKANAAGKFLLYLPPKEAGGPYSLQVKNLDSGEELVLQDILIGEVFLASGQSNMQYLLKGGWSPSDAAYERIPQHEEFLKKLSEIPADRLRFLEIPREASGVTEDSFHASWKNGLDEEALSTFSAVALWFAIKLIKELNVPVGMIGSYWGGTIAEAWISREKLLENPQDAKLVETVEESYYDFSNFGGEKDQSALGYPPVSVCEKYFKKDPGISDFAKNWAQEPLSPEWKPYSMPSLWTAEKLAGNGAFWVRCDVKIPESWAGRNLLLHLGPVDKQDISFFNGI